MIVRKAELSDAAQIAGIYNYYIENSIATFEVAAIDADESAWRMREVFALGYPYFVAENDGEIVGYAYAGIYKFRAAYLHSVEVSVYLKNGASGAGIGSRLYEGLFAEFEKMKNIHAVIAGISLPNDASVRLHEKFGMEKVAHFREVGFKFEKWIDVGYWELINRQSSILNRKL